MHDIEREVIKLTSYKAQRKFSDRQDYLKSLLNAVSKLTDDDFESLSDEAATWANAAVEAHNTKNTDLPDFDEITLDEEAADGDNNNDGPEAASDSEGAGDDPVSEDSEETAAAEAVKPKAKKAASKKAPKAGPKSELKHGDAEDVVVDKWGAMEGSKNSQALAMFEKGATTKEVKDSIGGTYYNVLKKMTKNGHKLVKEGAIIRLTHKMDLTAKKSKK